MSPLHACSAWRRLALALLICVLPVTATPLRGQDSFDVLIRNGRVLDGTGNPWYYADLGITGGRIVAMGDLAGARAKRVIDANGLFVAPGFIDVHTHAANGLATPGLSAARPILAQGVTTIVGNPDGEGPVDLAAQRKALLADGLGVNVALLVGHGSVRAAVMGMADRDPTPAELDRMRALVREAMENGAFGLSSGPWYAPGSFSKTEELVELAKVAAAYGGTYTSHVRDEADYNVGLVAAVDEVIRIAREARLPAVATHLKALGPRVWGFSGALISRIDRARDEGLEVFADQYPYTASSTNLKNSLVPRWALAGGDTAMFRRFSDLAEGPRLHAAMLENLDRRGGADRLQFRRYRPDPSIEGKTLQWAADRDGKPPVDEAVALMKGGVASIVSFNMDEGDVEALMRQSWMMTSSDGDLVPMGVGVPHPRTYGTHPRKIREYVLNRHVIDLPAAIRSMTSLPATVFHMRDRGLLREGAVADVVVFDLARVNDPATYQKPHQLAEGMVYVLVDGQFAIDRGAFAKALHGTVLSLKGTEQSAASR